MPITTLTPRKTRIEIRRGTPSSADRAPVTRLQRGQITDLELRRPHDRDWKVLLVAAQVGVRCPSIAAPQGLVCGARYSKSRALDKKDSHFNHASLSLGESAGRVNRRFSVATGCSARMSWYFAAGAAAQVAGRGQARARPASRVEERRRWRLPGDALIELEGGGQSSGQTLNPRRSSLSPQLRTSTI